MSNMPMAAELTAATLDGFGQETGPMLFLQGISSFNDGGGGFFSWNQYLTGTPPAIDGVNVFGSGAGPDTRFERFTNWIGPPPQISQSAPSRSLNSSFQLSTTKNCFATYSVSIAALLLAGGDVFLEISPDNSTWQTVSQFAVALGLTVTVTGSVYAFVPKNYYVRIRTAGTATITLLSQQESLI